MDLVFTAGSSNCAVQCVDVDIIDSTTAEETETFTVILTTKSSVLTLGNFVTTVTITDKASKYLDFMYIDDKAYQEK